MQRLSPTTWLVQERFRFLYLVEIGANCLVVKVPRAAGSGPNSGSFLLVLNPPPITSSALASLRAIEAEASARVEVIVSPGDWHHFSLPAAAAAFPEAALYCVERCVRKQPSLKGRAHVLDPRAPAVPELGDSVVLMALDGFSQDNMPWLMSGEPRGAPRVELVALDRGSGTLFINDHIFAPSAPGALPACNTGGFRVRDAAAAAASLARVAALGAERALFAHQPFPSCLLAPAGGAAALARILADAHKGFFAK